MSPMKVFTDILYLKSAEVLRNGTLPNIENTILIQLLQVGFGCLKSKYTEHIIQLVVCRIGHTGGKINFKFSIVS